MGIYIVINIVIVFVFAAIAYFVGPSLVDVIGVGGVSALFVIVGAVLAPFISNVIAGASGHSEESDDVVSKESTTLYVGNLPYRANEAEVQEHFETKGKVFSVRLMRDRRTGKRKGYGFVEVASKHADKMVSKLNDSDFQERSLRVRLAKEKQSDAE